jgi:hypothetical protein
MEREKLATVPEGGLIPGVMVLSESSHLHLLHSDLCFQKYAVFLSTYIHYYDMFAMYFYSFTPLHLLKVKCNI